MTHEQIALCDIYQKIRLDKDMIADLDFAKMLYRRSRDIMRGCNHQDPLGKTLFVHDAKLKLVWPLDGTVVKNVWRCSLCGRVTT